MKATGWMVVGTLLMVCGVVQGAALAPEPTAEQIAKMRAAAPKQARVKPEKGRKLLVFSLSWGFKHTSIPYGKKAIQILGEESKAFETTLSDDIRMFEPESLKQYDAVFFNNTNNEIFLPEEMDKLTAAERAAALDLDARLKKSFVVYLQGGGGLAVIHAGVASFREWDEFGNIMGARFENHPWGSGSKVWFKVEEPNHALGKAFKESPFALRDEIYQVKDPYSREKLRVLVSIDATKTEMTRQGIVRKDGDFAMTWIKSYGEGRVYYNAFGHDFDIFWNPEVLQHWLDGIQFVLGDLKADTTPSDVIRR